MFLVAHTAFPKSLNLKDYLYIKYDEKQKNPRFKKLNFEEYHKILLKFLRGLKVVYQIPGNQASKRVLTIVAFGQLPSKNMFNITVDGQDKMISVEQYFAIKNYTIKFPNLPTVQVRPKERNIFLPVEVCIVYFILRD